MIRPLLCVMMLIVDLNAVTKNTLQGGVSKKKTTQGWEAVSFL